MTYRTVEQLVRRSGVVALPGTATVREASQLMTEHHIGAVLVMAEARLEGIFTERDALSRDPRYFCIPRRRGSGNRREPPGRAGEPGKRTRLA